MRSFKIILAICLLVMAKPMQGQPPSSLGDYDQCGTAVDGYFMCIKFNRTAQRQDGTQTPEPAYYCNNNQILITATIFQGSEEGSYSFPSDLPSGNWSLDGNYCYSTGGSEGFYVTGGGYPAYSCTLNSIVEAGNPSMWPIPLTYGQHCISYTFEYGGVTFNSGIFTLPTNLNFIQNTSGSTAYKDNNTGDGASPYATVYMYPPQTTDVIEGTFTSFVGEYTPPLSQIMAYETLTVDPNNPVLIESGSVLYTMTGSGTPVLSGNPYGYGGIYLGGGPSFKVAKGGVFKASPKGLCSLTYASPSSLCDASPGVAGYRQSIAIKDSVLVKTPYVSVYPNPTAGTVNIALGSPTEQTASVVFYNSLGQQVYATSTSFSETKVVETDISNEPDGIYIVQVSLGGMISTQKVVLAK